MKFSTSVTRSREYAAKAALAVLPLLLGAGEARAAAVTLNPDSVLSATGPGILNAAPGSFSLVPTSLGDVDGQKLVGSGLFRNQVLPVIGPDGLSNDNILIRGTGTASGTFTGDSLGVKWDFTLSEVFDCNICEDTVNSSSWAVYFWVSRDFEETHVFEYEGGGVTGVPFLGHHEGTGQITGLNGFSPTNWWMSLEIEYLGNGDLQVDIPANSLAIPGATVPEPGTYALMGAGLGLLALLRRRR